MPSDVPSDVPFDVLNYMYLTLDKVAKDQLQGLTSMLD